MRPEPSTRIVAVEPWHHNVQQDEGGVEVRCDGERLIPTGGRLQDTMVPQDFLQDGDIGGVIVDDEHAAVTGHVSTPFVCLRPCPKGWLVGPPQGVTGRPGTHDRAVRGRVVWLIRRAQRERHEEHRPPAGRFSAQMRPWWAVTVSRQIAKPSPVPPAPVLVRLDWTNWSKTASSSSSGMPGP